MSLSTKEYFLRETIKSIKRNGFMSIASISTVAISLLVLGLFTLGISNIHNLSNYLESQVEMTVYMEDKATDTQLKEMEKKLSGLKGVRKVTAVSKKEAMDRFQKRLGDQAGLLRALGEENPFPNYFEVQVENPEIIKKLAPTVDKMPLVETAKFGQEMVENLFSLTKVLRTGGIILILFMSFATLFIIINTIRLTVFARRKEVTIMKYVGATDWFIRWPFILEGMLLGFGGGLIACFIVDIIYRGLMAEIYTSLAFFPLLPVWPTLFYVDLFLLFYGTVIGAAGSCLSLKKFLKV